MFRQFKLIPKMSGFWTILHLLRQSIWEKLHCSAKASHQTGNIKTHIPAESAKYQWGPTTV